MIKFIKRILRKTLYRKLDPKTQDKVIELCAYKHIITILCWCFLGVAYIFPFIPLAIVDACENISLSTNFAVLIFLAVYVIGGVMFIRKFYEQIKIFLQLISDKVHFELCTYKGEALNKIDFYKIKRRNPKLYKQISYQKCYKSGFEVCFQLVKTLKKGDVELLAVKPFIPDDKSAMDMHMYATYVHNGWAFDVHSHRQYPLEKFHEIYEAEVYKTVLYIQLKNMSYEQFEDEEIKALEDWCKYFQKAE